VGDVVGGAERVRGPRGHEREERGEHDPEAQREPEAVDAGLEGLAAAARSDASGDGRGGRVGEEDAEPDERRQERRGDRQRGELGGAEVAHDSAVDEDEQRFGNERTECGDGEREDLAVEAAGRDGGLVGALRRVAREISVHSSTG